MLIKAWTVLVFDKIPAPNKVYEVMMFVGHTTWIRPRVLVCTAGSDVSSEAAISQLTLPSSR
jgi:hypothetical protein